MLHRANVVATPRWLFSFFILWSVTVLAGATISKEKAISLVVALPEVKAWTKYLEERSKGVTRAVLVADDEIEISSKRYLPVRFYESQTSHMHGWETFLVRTDGKEILIENNVDPLEGPLSLEQWRKTKKPSDRIMK